MNMSSEIRVRTEDLHRGLYNDLKNLAVGDMHELFSLCVFMAYKKQKSKTLKNKEDRFWSKTFSPEEWACFYSIILEENDMDMSTIQDDRKVLQRIEEYANAGMELLIDGLLSDHLTKSINNELRIDKGFSKELPKNFLYYIANSIK